MTTERVAPEAAVPDDVVDRLLWHDAQYVLAHHQRAEDSCTCCGASWPCTARRLAERADAASRLPWQDGWSPYDPDATVTLPEWRAAHRNTPLAHRPRPSAR